MNYEIIEMIPYSGSAAKVYSIIPEGEDISLFEKFVLQHKSGYKDELKEILMRLYQIGNTTGARSSFFKHEGNKEFELKYGRYVWALYDEEDKKLRLYCIKFGTVAIILGGGGYKSKDTIKWQEDEKLSEEVNKIMVYAACIFEQLDKGELYWSKDKTEFEGNLKNYDNE